MKWVHGDQTRPCSKCGTSKPLSAFARHGASAHGVRAHCRECYNAGRRLHYALPEVKAAKNEIRREYESRPDVAARKKAMRSVPHIAKSARAARVRYLAKPEVRERLLKKRKQFESTPIVRARMVLQAALTRANKRALPFDLTLPWVAERVLMGRCEVTGMPFVFDRQRGGTRRNPFAPSVDQITAGLGYTKENSRVVLVAINLALCDWGLDQFLKIAANALESNGYAVTLKKSQAAA